MDFIISYSNGFNQAATTVNLENPLFNLKINKSEIQKVFSKEIHCMRQFSDQYIVDIEKTFNETFGSLNRYEAYRFKNETIRYVCN